MGDDGGTRHRSAVGNYADFFVGILAGTAGWAGAVEANGQIIYTFGRNHCKSVDAPIAAIYKLINELISDTHCIGVWFGMSCGALSSE